MLNDFGRQLCAKMWRPTSGITQCVQSCLVARSRASCTNNSALNARFSMSSEPVRRRPRLLDGVAVSSHFRLASNNSPTHHGQMRCFQLSFALLHQDWRNSLRSHSRAGNDPFKNVGTVFITAARCSTMLPTSTISRLLSASLT